MAAKSKKDILSRGLDYLDNKFFKKQSAGVIDGEEVFTRRAGLDKPVNWLKETSSSENSLMMASSAYTAGLGGVTGGLASIGTDDSLLGSMAEGAAIGGIAGGFLQRRRSLRTRTGGYADEIASLKGKKMASGKGAGKTQAIFNEATARGDKGMAAQYQKKMNRTADLNSNFDQKIKSNKYAMKTPTINHLGVALGAGGVTLAHNVLTSNNSI